MKWFSFMKPRETASSGPARGVQPRGAGAPRVTGPAAPQPVRNLIVIRPVEAGGEDPLETRLEELRDRWQCALAASGAEALEWLARGGVAAIVAPEQASDGAGAEILREVARRFPGVVRVWRGPMEKAGAAGAAGGLPPHLLPEPASLEDFDRAVGRALAIEGWLGGDRGRALLARMEHLPAMPSLYAQVMAELRKDDPSIEAVAEVIAKDPALTAKMLQTVNSPIFALRRPVGTAYEAVTFLGAERTKALILMASLSLHGSLTRCEGFSQENFWQHSLSVATWARVLALAEMKDASEADQAFTAGILHDVGKLLFASNVAPDYGPVLAEALTRGVPVHVVERERLGLDHGSLGAALLGTWGLPMRLLEAVAWHDEPAQSADQNYSLLTAVHVANALEYERKAGETGAAPAVPSSAPKPVGPGPGTTGAGLAGGGGPAIVSAAAAGASAATPVSAQAQVPAVAVITTPQLDWVYLARLGIDALVDRWRQLIGCRPQPKRP